MPAAEKGSRRPHLQPLPRHHQGSLRRHAPRRADPFRRRSKKHREAGGGEAPLPGAAPAGRGRPPTASRSPADAQGRARKIPTGRPLSSSSAGIRFVPPATCRGERRSCHADGVVIISTAAPPQIRRRSRSGPGPSRRSATTSNCSSPSRRRKATSLSPPFARHHQRRVGTAGEEDRKFPARAQEGADEAELDPPVGPGGEEFLHRALVQPGEQRPPPRVIDGTAVVGIDQAEIPQLGPPDKNRARPARWP